MTHSEFVPYLIVGFTVVGIVLQISAIANYTREIKFLKVLKSRIIDLLDEVDHRPLKAEELLAEEGIPEKSMVATRTIELEKFSQYPGMVALHDLGAVAAEGDAGRIKNAVPNVLIASLLVVGLFGTLWSLKDTLQSEELRRFIDKGGDASASSFQEALGPVLNGFGSAFKASLYGVGGTIVLIFIRIFVRARRELCFEGIEHFVVECLLPYYIEPEKSLLQRATATIKESTRRFGEVTKDMNRSAGLMSSAVADLNKSTSEANRTFGADGAVVYHLSQFSDKVISFNDNAIELAKHHDKTISAIEQISTSNVNISESLRSAITYQQNTQNKNSEELKRLVTTVANSSEQSKKDLIVGLSSLEDSNAKVVTALNMSTENNIKQSSKIVEAVAHSYGGSLERLNIENKNLLDNLAEYNNQQLGKRTAAFDELISNLKSLTLKLDTIALKEDRIDIAAFGEFRTHLNGVNDKLSEVLKVNAEAIGNSFKVHNKLDQKMLKSFEDFSSRVNTLSRVIDKVAEAGSPEHNKLMDKFKNFIGK